jgi:uncharacterized protein (DUF486 family)
MLQIPCEICDQLIDVSQLKVHQVIIRFIIAKFIFEFFSNLFLETMQGKR